MCGICGIYNYKNDDIVEHNIISKMTNSMIHRGPDDFGFHINGSIGLGFRRLSIIDLNGGHQPMSDMNKNLWIIFNGEIYNFLELRNELIKHEHRFKSKSDTEVIVHGYEQWGVNLFKKLNGMFAICIWDVNNQKLILARDRMGIKPIYYYINNGSLIFGSEIKPILIALKKNPEIDTTALNHFLRYRYTPAPLSIFEGIKKLEPGHFITFYKGKYKKNRWYDPRPKQLNSDLNIKRIEEELGIIYCNAIKRQLISDVPVGLLLSGGMDSGLLLAIMNKFGNDWKTYTVGYGKDYKNDELKYALDTANLLNAKNYSVQINKEQFISSLPKIIKFLEEPIASSSIIPMYHVSERASVDVKVALIGQGPDELFGGYKRHLGVRYNSYWRILPLSFRKIIKNLLSNLTNNETILRGLYSLDVNDRLKRYQQIFSIVPGNRIDDLFLEGIIEINPGDKILEYWQEYENAISNLDELGGFQHIELRSSLPEELLMYADKLSMANSIELRVPYLDNEVVDYVECLPQSFKIKFGIRKYIHKKVAKNYIPSKIRNRKKRGFAVDVVDNWFKDTLSGGLTDYLLDNNSELYNYLDQQKVINLLKEHEKGFYNHHKILFSLVVFEEWLRSFKSSTR